MKKYMCDFETRTNSLLNTSIWAWGICLVGQESIEYGTDIKEFIDYISSIGGGIFYFHNLKFDGEFIASFLFKMGYKFTDNKKLGEMEFKALISDMGMWYTMEFKYKGKKIILRDSLKKLNFPVADIAQAYDLPYQKLEIDYHAKRDFNYILTQKEVDYLKSDVVIVSLALDKQFGEGLNELTQGSDALHQYKEIMGDEFRRLFPVLSLDVDSYIRQFYRGGYTYTNPIHQGEIVHDGFSIDVNSLYPSVMYDKPMPYGYPIKFLNKYEYNEKYPLYMQRLRCTFELKAGCLPTIQIKNSNHFQSNEYLTSSDGEFCELFLTSICYL